MKRRRRGVVFGPTSSCRIIYRTTKARLNPFDWLSIRESKLNCIWFHFPLSFLPFIWIKHVTNPTLSNFNLFSNPWAVTHDNDVVQNSLNSHQILLGYSNILKTEKKKAHVTRVICSVLLHNVTMFLPWRQAPWEEERKKVSLSMNNTFVS